MGYISNFIVYALAMVGVIMLALVVFKYTTGVKVSSNKHSGGLKVTDTLSLSPRKTLYIVETDGERFLIAGDTDRTTLISRLDYKTKSLQNKSSNNENISDENLGIYSTKRSPYDSLIRSLAKK